MKFIVYSRSWAGGLKNTPKEILEKYCAATPVEVPAIDKYNAMHYIIDITPDEMMSIVSSQEFDIMTIGARDGSEKMLAFDELRRMFRQR